MKTIKKIFNTLFSELRKELFSEGAFRIYCLLLLFVSALLAIDAGIKGDYSKMQNHIIWNIWIGLVVYYSITKEIKEIEVESYKEYTNALERGVKELNELVDAYKEKDSFQKQLIAKHEERTKELEHQIVLHEQLQTISDKEIGLLKKLQKASDKIIDQYKNNKESRF